jgi:hypothetical protein
MYSMMLGFKVMTMLMQSLQEDDAGGFFHCPRAPSVPDNYRKLCLGWKRSTRRVQNLVPEDAILMPEQG